MAIIFIDDFGRLPLYKPEFEFYSLGGIDKTSIDREMLEVSPPLEPHGPDQRSPLSKRTNRKPKPRSFAILSSVMQNWQPSDASVARRYLVDEVMQMLRAKEYSCTKSCIPALLVDNRFPIDLIHYRSEQDLNELIGRMLWMRQEFNSGLGLLFGIPGKETAANLAETNGGIFSTKQD